MSPGQRLAAWRRICGLSVRQLAKAAGLHASALSRMEHGHQSPKAEELERIARVLRISMPEFYGEIGRRVS